MIFIFIIIFNIPRIFSEDVPCKKLYFFGNNIYNKVLFSPVIIVGKRGMMIPIENELYKATIDIKNVIKGSLGEWKKNILIAGPFSLKSDTNDLCQFKIDGEDQIYFLQVLSSQNGEYNIIFQTEIANKENLELVNKTICNNCAEIPKLIINDKSSTDDEIVLDCITNSKPPSLLKWTIPDGLNATLIQLRNGIRLNIKSVRNNINDIYICAGANILGESTANIIIKDKVTRCAMNDKLLCNDHGKCYKDKIDDGKMFCRCDPGFLGTRCSDNPKKLSTDYLIRVLNIDTAICNNNGKGYINVVTKQQYCICNDEFSGKTCSKNEIISKNEGKLLRNNNNIEKSVNNKHELRKILDEFSSKMAAKYMIIGGLIVIGGCIIILITILIMWKLCRHQTKRTKDETDKRSFGTTNTLNGSDLRPIAQFNDNVTLLPANTEKSKVPTQSKPKNSSNDNINLDNYNSYLSNGMFGFNATNIQDQSTTKRIAL